MSSRKSFHVRTILPALVSLALVFGLSIWRTLPEQPLQKTIRPRFPRPMFISAPWRCDLPNFESEPTTIGRKEFTAPIETAIVSSQALATSSIAPSQGQIAWIVDGDAETDMTGGNEVSFENPPCWIQLDLGSTRFIDHIWLWHGEGTWSRRQTPEVFEDVIVQISNDGEFRSGVTTLFNSDDDGSCGQGKGADPTYMESNHGRGVSAKGQPARFVRIWGGKAYSGGPCRFTEVTVWGR